MAKSKTPGGSRPGKVDLQAYPFIYCDSCKEIQPMKLGPMPVDKDNDHAAVDLLCAECTRIVATLHQHK